MIILEKRGADRQTTVRDDDEQALRLQFSVIKKGRRRIKGIGRIKES